MIKQSSMEKNIESRFLNQKLLIDIVEIMGDVIIAAKDVYLILKNVQFHRWNKEWH